MANSEEKDTRKVITQKKRVESRRTGASERLTVLSEFLKTVPQLKRPKRSPLVFQSYVEVDNRGVVYLVFEKVRE